VRCVIGLGANLGDRLATFESAVRELCALGELCGLSHLYETDPVGGPVQPDYFNAAVCLRTELAPMILLKQLLDVELAHGRIREGRWGPRQLDLDILWIEGFATHEPGLTVPHARLLERNFALKPLVEAAPDARDPNNGLEYAELPLAQSLVGMRLRGARTGGSPRLNSGNDSLWNERR